jgi:hypothetical protein
MEKRYDSKFHSVFATLRQMLETQFHPNDRSDFTLGPAQFEETA